MASKTEFIYGVFIFYTVITLFITLFGSLVLNTGLDIVTPEVQLENPLGTNGYDNEYITETNYCDTGLDETGITSLKNMLTPVFMRPKCITQTSEQVGHNYVEGLLEEADEGKESKFGFFPSMVVGFTLVPDWLNAIIFTPLIIALLFVLVTTIGGLIFDGGA